MVYGNFDGEAVDEEQPAAIRSASTARSSSAARSSSSPTSRCSTCPTRSCGRRRSTASAASAGASARSSSRTRCAARRSRVDGDGGERLDFTYIDDLVDGICRCIEQPDGAQPDLQPDLRRGPLAQRDGRDRPSSSFPAIEVEHVERDALMPERGTLNVDKARALHRLRAAVPARAWASAQYIEWYRGLFDRRRRHRASSATAR